MVYAVRKDGKGWRAIADASECGPDEDFSEEQPSSPVREAISRINKADIWRRATDQEAVMIDAMLNAQSIKLQRLWSDAEYLSTGDELFGAIKAGAAGLFGSDRADELLAPSE